MVAVIDDAALVGRGRAAADDAAHRVRLVGGAAHPAQAVLDDAIDERAAARAAATVVGEAAHVAVAEREARERRLLPEVDVAAQPDIDAVVRAVAVDDGRGRAILRAHLQREVARDDDARVGAVAHEDFVERAVGGIRGVGGVNGGLYAGEGVGPVGAVLAARARRRHVERRAKGRGECREQRSECYEQCLFHGVPFKSRLRSSDETKAEHLNRDAQSLQSLP